MFLKDGKQEDENLAANLFKSGSRIDIDLKIPDNPTDVGEGCEWTEYHEFPSIVEIRSDYDFQHYMGCLIQWSNVVGFGDKETALSMCPAGLR